MKTVVFSSDGNAKSAIKLGFPVLSHSTYIEQDPPDNVIAWGRSDSPSGRVKQVNSCDAISKAISKSWMLAHMSENGVKTPMMVESGSSWRGRDMVVRANEHSGGEGFRVAHSGSIRDGEIGTEYIPADSENRVWFVGSSLLAGKRVPVTDEDRVMANQQFVCRSKWGYQFYSEVPDKMREIALKIKENSGLDFGAIDLIWKRPDYYFLEVNTAPALDHGVVINFMRSCLRSMVN